MVNNSIPDDVRRRRENLLKIERLDDLIRECKQLTAYVSALAGEEAELPYLFLGKPNIKHITVERHDGSTSRISAHDAPQAAELGVRLPRAYSQDQVS